jgi:hypothetical protein
MLFSLRSAVCGTAITCIVHTYYVTSNIFPVSIGVSPPNNNILTTLFFDQRRPRKGLTMSAAHPLVCLFVRPSVHPSVRPSVRPSVLYSNSYVGSSIIWHDINPDRWNAMTLQRSTIHQLNSTNAVHSHGQHVCGRCLQRTDNVRATLRGGSRGNDTPRPSDLGALSPDIRRTTKFNKMRLGPL